MRAVHADRRPAVPVIGERAWQVFWTLDGRRQGNGHAALAISHQEIDACSRLYGVRLAPWELRALDAMEGVRLDWLNRDREAEKRQEPMTPALFMAMFGGKGKQR